MKTIILFATSTFLLSLALASTSGAGAKNIAPSGVTQKASQSSNEIAQYQAFIQKAKAVYDESGDEAEGIGGTYASYLRTSQNIAKLPELASFKVLSAEELFAIINYSDLSYKVINHYLRGDTASIQVDPYLPEMTVDIYKIEISILKSGLHKLPAFQGSVFRGEFYGDELDFENVEQNAQSRFDAWEVGAVVQDNGFRSTSRDSASSFVTGSLIVYEMKSKTGISIEKISTREAEQEVLFQPGTRFKVVKKEVQPFQPTNLFPFSKRYKIWLEEVE